MASTKQIHIAAGFGRRTERPFVSLRLGDEFSQLTPTRAREIAARLFQAAESADSDAFLIGYLGTQSKLTETQRGALLVEFRAFRKRVRAQENADG
jgi:hypothetical protein